MGCVTGERLRAQVRHLADSAGSSRTGSDQGAFLELLTLAQSHAQDAAREAVEMNQSNDAAAAIQTLRSIEQTWQEHRTFNVRHRHDKRLFGLKLLMARSAYGLLIGTAGAAVYVILNHKSFSATVVAEAGTTLLVQTAGLMAWCWRLVVAREEPQPAPVTFAGRATVSTMDASTAPDPADDRNAG